MTRINLVDPKDLIRQHLIAEYHELPRIFGLVYAQQKKGKTPKDITIPPTYRLGTGHMTFFYDKLKFLEERFKLLVEEMGRRGFNAAHTSIPNFTKEISPEWWGNYEPTPEDIKISKERIDQRRMEIESR